MDYDKYLDIQAEYQNEKIREDYFEQTSLKLQSKRFDELISVLPPDNVYLIVFEILRKLDLEDLIDLVPSIYNNDLKQLLIEEIIRLNKEGDL